MLILINSAVFSTVIFSIVFFLAIFASSRFKKTKEILPNSLSAELKGLAIFFIIFSHIGYFLVADHRFLFPLSIMAGVGVDLFLFLSGFGITASAIKNNFSPASFYKKRLLKLFTPFWIILISFLALDFLVLGITYSWQFTLKAIFGFFPTADLYNDLNSPFWYFTLILFYYLVFPWVFSKKYVWVSAIVIYDITWLILQQNFEIISKVSFFYNLHIMAFPLGMLFFWLSSKFDFVALKDKVISNLKINKYVNKYAVSVVQCLLSTFLAVFIYYLAYEFGYIPNLAKAQLFSVFTMFLVVLFFIIKKFEFRLLGLFGLYSYEIYLFHWPILYRYDFLYKYTPAYIATILYLILFLILAWLLQKLSTFILKVVQLRSEN